MVWTRLLFLGVGDEDQSDVDGLGVHTDPVVGVDSPSRLVRPAVVGGEAVVDDLAVGAAGPDEDCDEAEGENLR